MYKKNFFKNTYEIITVKGLCCGLGSIIIDLIICERFPSWIYFLFALLLGFVAYELSIFFYIKAQNKLGAASTSAFYSVNPFIAVIISLIIFRDKPSWNFYLSLGIMVIGIILIIIDTLKRKHAHSHIHYLTHTYDCTTHTHIIEHTHEHIHVIGENKHSHHHSEQELLNSIDHK